MTGRALESGQIGMPRTCARVGRPVARVLGQRSGPLRVLLAVSGCMVALAAGLLVVTFVVALWATDRQKAAPGGELSEIQIGDPAPDFTLAATDGTMVSLRDYRGSPVLINFWATWCLPCRMEEAALKRAAEAQAETGLVVLGVNQGESPERAKAYARERGIDYRILVDPDGRIGARYGIVGMPITIWVDADGKVRHVDHGVMTDDRIERQVERLGESER